MKIKVKKFGGTSLATSSHILHLAKNIRKEIADGYKPVIVVSAMDKTTDDLIFLADKICSKPNRREMDMLLTSGERVSMALFSMALNSLNIKSYSFTGSQVGIITTSSHTNAKIINIKGQRIIDALNNDVVPVIAGFQGVSKEKEITTMGRGGSDTTAVAIAAFLGAEICEIYTDVDGIFTVDPRIVMNAKPIKNISYDEMLCFAALGSGVIHPRAIRIAKKYNVKLIVKSSFNEGAGTMITKKENMEENRIMGISCKNNQTLINIKSTSGILDIVKTLNENNLKINGFIQKYADNISFIVDTDDVHSFLSSIENISDSVSISNDIGIVSLIGTVINDDKDLIVKIIKCTEKYKNDILALMNSEFSVSIVTKKTFTEKITIKLSKEFNLEKTD